jgi:enoyl-CoA hydratase
MPAAPVDGVRIDDNDGVLVITIDRPRVRNAVDLAAAKRIATGLEDLDARSGLAVGVVTGAGGTFCAGKDLKAFAAGEPEAFVGDRGFAGLTRATVRKPLIAAVEGWALGGGCEIALACDLIVAASDAQFGQPEVRLGLVAPEGGMVRLPRRLPAAIALEMLLTGEPVTAARAARHGLVNRLVPPGQALAEALQLAARIRRNAPLAVAATKRIVHQTIDLPEDTAFREQDHLAAPVFTSADFQEGMRAFIDGRPPVWRNR